MQALNRARVRASVASINREYPRARETPWRPDSTTSSVFFIVELELAFYNTGTPAVPASFLSMKVVSFWLQRKASRQRAAFNSGAAGAKPATGSAAGGQFGGQLGFIIRSVNVVRCKIPCTSTTHLSRSSTSPFTQSVGFSGQPGLKTVMVGKKPAGLTSCAPGRWRVQKIAPGSPITATAKHFWSASFW